MTIGLEGATPQILAHYSDGATVTASAEFIDANTLATAAHALTRNGVIASSVDLIINGVATPVDVSSINAKIIFADRFGPTSAQAIASDYATFSTGDKALGLDLGIFAIDKDNSVKSADVTISGHPVTNPGVLIQPYGQMSGQNQDAAPITNLTGVTPGLVDGLSGGAVATPFHDSGVGIPYIVRELVGIVATGSADGKTGAAVDMSSSTVSDLVQWAAADDAKVVAAVKAAALAETAHRLAPDFESAFFQEQVANLSQGGAVASSAAAAITNKVNSTLDQVLTPDILPLFVQLFGNKVLHLTIPGDIAQIIGAKMAVSSQAEHDIFQLGANYLIDGVVDLVGVNTTPT